MKRLARATNYWPGLDLLWRAGDWRSLALALATAWLVCLLTLATFVWTELAPPAVRAVGWIVAAAVWAVFFWRSIRLGNENRVDENDDSTGDQPGRDLFSEALNEYLSRNWLEAERRLRAMLARHGDDVNARLLLATLLRHGGRIDEARRELNHLQRMEAAERWRFEIDAERVALDRMEKTTETETQDEKINPDRPGNPDGQPGAGHASPKAA
jgi:hypothetical protein